LLAQGKRDDARKAFEAAYKGLDERNDYRRLVEVKLNSLGVDVEAKKAEAVPISPAAASPLQAPAPAATASGEKK
jgi:Tetratricopeptide repeat-like domain